MVTLRHGFVAFAALWQSALSSAISQQLDCDLRQLLYNRSLSLSTLASTQSAVWDALQLTAACGFEYGQVEVSRQSASRGIDEESVSASGFYVDPASGSDANPGTQQQPFSTVARAVRASRGGDAPAAIYLRSGTHYLANPITLYPSDSGISFQSYDSGPAVVSGGVVLDAALTWQPYNVSKSSNIYVAKLDLARLGLRGGFSSLFVNGSRAVRARWPNANPERTIWPVGYASAASWAPPSTAFSPPTEIYISQPSRSKDDPFYPQFQLCGGSNSTVGAFSPPESFWGCVDSPVTSGAQYVLPTGLSWDPASPPPHSAQWANGSSAIVHAAHQSYWGNWMFEVASFNPANASLSLGAGGWQEARGAAAGSDWFIENLLVELDQPEEWLLEVTPDGASGQLYYFFNGTSPSSDGSGGSAPVFVAAKLENLFTLEGSKEAPVTNVSFSGLTFSHTAPTFMKPFAVMSGGDASIFVGAAVLLRGTQNVTIQRCNFTRVGGNALFLHRYNARASILDTEFSWTGDNAIGLMGASRLVDGTDLDVPQNTLVAGNLFREIGLYVKQAGPLYQALSLNTSFVRNVAFNMPRAAVNINDGFGGGHLIDSNLLFNCVRETSDHGCVNTWDRQPFLTGEAGNGGDTMIPALSVIRRNLIMSNYASLWGVDHDDGSNSYLVEENLVLYSGFKTYLGFGKVARDNLYLYADITAGPSGTGSAEVDAALPLGALKGLRGPSGSTSARRPTGYGSGNSGWPYCACDNGVGSLSPSQMDSWNNNTCISSSQGGVYQFSACDPSSPLNGGIPTLGNNTIYVPGATFSYACGSATWNLTSAQAAGVDLGSSVHDLPPDSAVVQMAVAKVAGWGQ